MNTLYDQDAEEQLIRRVSQAPSRGFINQWFDLLMYLIDKTRLPNDGKILVTSLASSRGFGVSVNTRGAFALYTRSNPSANPKMDHTINYVPVPGGGTQVYCCRDNLWARV